MRLLRLSKHHLNLTPFLLRLRRSVQCPSSAYRNVLGRPIQSRSCRQRKRCNDLQNPRQSVFEFFLSRFPQDPKLRRRDTRASTTLRRFKQVQVNLTLFSLFRDQCWQPGQK